MANVNDEILTRLATLRRDYERGSLQLQELTQQETVLRETLLRISGAIQAFEELANECAAENGRSSRPGPIGPATVA
jgi:hypothetical protein